LESKGKGAKEMETAVQTKIVAKYSGHSVKANKNVDISFVVGYDQLTSSIQLLQLLNVDVNIKAKLPDEKPMDLGNFRVKAVNIDHDGESKLMFNGMDDFVDTNAINRLVGSELLQLKFEGTVDVEEGGEEDENCEE
jgi:hypothetical protein